MATGLDTSEVGLAGRLPLLDLAALPFQLYMGVLPHDEDEVSEGCSGL